MATQPKGIVAGGRAIRRPPAAGALGLVVLLASGPSRAEPGEMHLPADPLLARLIGEALAAGPEVARTTAAQQAERQRGPQAGALPDPMLQIGIQNDGFTSLQIGRMDTSFASVMVAQTLPWPGRLQTRRAVADLGAAQAQQGIERARLSLEAGIRRLYLDLLLVRERLDLLNQLDGIWQRSLGIARARYESGEGAQSDVLRAQLERNRLRLREFGLRGEEKKLVQALNRLAGRPLDATLAPTPRLRQLAALPPLQPLFSADSVLARSPELAAARLATTRADRTLELAKGARAPDLTVSAGYMFRGQLPPMWLLTVGAPLPVFAAHKQDRAMDEAQSWTRAIQSERAGVEQALRARSGERQVAFAATLQTLSLFETGLLVQSEATTASTLAQYQVGRVPFASVLDANAGFIVDQDGYLEALATGHRLLIAEAEASLADTVMPTAGIGGGAAMSTGASSNPAMKPNPSSGSSPAGTSAPGM